MAVKKTLAAKNPQEKGRRMAGASRKAQTLLERIIERRTKPSPMRALQPEALEEGQVLVAWVQGQIDSAEAQAALEVKTQGQIHQKAGTMLRNLAAGQYISIVWNKAR